MKRKTAVLLSIVLIFMLLSSCATSKVEPVAVPTSEPSKPEAESSAQPEAGQITTSQSEAAQQEAVQPAAQKGRGRTVIFQAAAQNDQHIFIFLCLIAGSDNIRRG